MELVVLAVVILVLYGVIRLFALMIAGVAGTRYRSYRQLAQRFRGKYESRGLSDPPTVSFFHRGSSVRVGLAPSVAGQAAPPRTRVVTRFGQGLPLRLELAPITRPSPPQPPRGTRLVRLGDPNVDHKYVVQANDPEIAQEFLQPAVQQALETLRRFAPPSGMLVSINPERLLVQVDRDLGTSAEALTVAVTQTLILHDHLQTSVAARLAQGIDILKAGSAAPEDTGPPLCEVCGDPILTHHVICTRCRTPHHRDCWTFVGGCSIFGCHNTQCESVNS